MMTTDGDSAGALYILEDINDDNDYAESGEITKVTENSNTSSTFSLNEEDRFGQSIATDGTTIFVGARNDDDGGDSAGAVYTFSLEKTFSAELTSAEMQALNTGTVTVTTTTITDRAGNSGTGSVTTFAYEEDTTAPTLSSPSSIGTISDNTPEFSFTSDEAGAITYGGDCTSTEDTEALAEANTVTFDVLADGAHSNCTVTVTDAATNASSALAVPTFTIDSTAPVISAIALANDVTDGYLTGSEITNTNNLITAPTVTEATGTTTYKLTKRIETGCASFPGGDYTATIPQSDDVASDGIYKICAKAADALSNTSYRNSPIFIRDTAVPTMSFNQISDGTVDETEDDDDIPITGETSADTKTLTLSITDTTTTYTKTAILSAFATLEQKIPQSSSTGSFSLNIDDYFGSSVATDGTRIIVGASSDDDGESGAGAIYILENTNNDNDYADANEIIKVSDTQNTGDSLSLGSGDSFGKSVATDGTRIIVGASGDDDGESGAGAIYILENTNNDNDYADANEIIKVSDTQNTGDNLSLGSGDSFGASVATDGTRIIVGAQNDDDGETNAGAIYILEDKNNDNDYADVDEIIKVSNTQNTGSNLSLGSSDRFGSSVATDGTRVIVGAYQDDDGGTNTGAIYILEDTNNDGDYTESGEIIKVSKDSNTSNTFSPGNQSNFGASVATDGTRIFAGANNDGEDYAGALYIFEDINGDNDYGESGEITKVTEGSNTDNAFSLNEEDGFGSSIATDGTRIIVGADGDSDGGYDAGAIYTLSLEKTFSTELTSAEMQALDAGTVTVTATTITDRAGNSGTGSETTFAYSITDTDTTAPTLSSPSSIGTTNDNTPEFTFTSDEAGAITYGGDCTSTEDTEALAEANTVTFDVLEDGAHSNCTVTVTDDATNESAALAVPTFTIDSTAPVISTIALANDVTDGYLTPTEITNTNNLITAPTVTGATGSTTYKLTKRTETECASFSDYTATIPQSDDVANDGIYKICAKAADALSNTSYRNAPLFIRDTAGPTMSFNSISDGTVDTTEDDTDVPITGETSPDTKTLTLSITDTTTTYTKTPTLSAFAALEQKIPANSSTGSFSLDSTDNFGSSIATDGTRIFVGATGDDDGGTDAGAIYIFKDTNNDGSYTESGEIIKVSDTQNTGENLSLSLGDYFGISVATDGTRIIVGAQRDDDGESGAGAIYIFEDTDNDGDYDESGEIIKVSKTSNTGGNLSLEALDYFGTSVATDGTRIIVGAPYDDDGGSGAGAIYILEDKNNDNDYADSGEIIKVTEGSNTDNTFLLDNADFFGTSVATDGTRIIVGAIQDDDGESSAGAIYILEDKNNDNDYAESGEVIKVSKASSTDSNLSQLGGGDNFGQSVATDGTRIIVGAYQDDDGGSNAGAIYILEDMNNNGDYADSGEITKVTEGSNTSSTFSLDNNDYFGQSVATDGTIIFVGAPQDDDGGGDAGAIYTFYLEKTFSTELTSAEMQALNTGTVTVATTTITDRAGNSGTGSETTFAYSIADTDTTAPTLSDPSDIGTATGGAEFTFTSDEAGTITYGGGCVSSDTEAIDGENTVTLEALSEGVNSSCTVTVTDAADNASSALSVPAFTFRDAPTYHTIYNGTMVPGSFNGTDGTVWGYKIAGITASGAPEQTTFGSLTPDTFTVSTTVHTVAYMMTGSEDPGTIDTLLSPVLYHKALAPKGSMLLTGTTTDTQYELPFSNFSNSNSADRFFLGGNSDENLFNFFATNNQVTIEITDEIFSIFRANTGYDRAQLTWAAPSGITGISRYQYNQDDSGWSDIPSSTGTTTSYLAEDLSPGVSYEFAIRALNSSNTVLATSRWIPVIPNKLQDETSGIFMLTPNNSYHRNDFGSAAALSLDGNTLYVGAQGDYSTEGDSGSVYVFAKDATGAWAYNTKITHDTHNLTLDANYYFGSSVALSQDESMLIVGAEGVHTTTFSEQNVRTTINEHGAVYIFTKDNNDNWTKSGEITHDADSLPLATNDHFGSAAALSSDGSTLFVGAREDDTGGDNRGAVYVFTKDNDENWTYSTKIAHGTHSLTLSNTDQFGSSLALSLDGSTLVVGAATDDTEGADRGAIHIFTKDSDNNWTHSTKIDSSFSDADFTLSDSDLFGSALAFSPNGSTLLIGTEKDDTGGTNRGAIHVFAKGSGDTWTYERKIANDAEGLTLGNGDNFGSSLALSADGGTLFAGATGDYADERRKGALHILDSGIEASAAPILFAPSDIGTTADTTPDFSFYTTEAGTIAYTGDCASAQTTATAGTNVITFNTLSSGAHSDCALTVTDSDSNTSAALAVPEFTITSSLDVTVNIGYDKVQLTWTQPSDSTNIAKYQYKQDTGSWTDISGSGAATTAHLIENLTPNTGYTFKIRALDSDNAVITESGDITGTPDVITIDTAGSVFGFATALSADETVLAIGAIGIESYRGAVYLFTKSNDGIWLQDEVIDSSFNGLTLSSSDHFGNALALSADGGTLFVGARFSDIGYLDEVGAAYVFVKDGSDNWTYETKITHNTHGLSLNAGDDFGYSLTASGDGNTLIVATNRSSMYLFTRDNGVWSYNSKISETTEQVATSVLLSPDGRTLFAGDPGFNYEEGIVYLFTKNNDVWSYSGRSIERGFDGLTLPGAVPRFGHAMALSSDGNTLYIFANSGDGDEINNTVYVFTGQGTSWNYVTSVTSPNAQDFPFGFSLATTSDGNTLYAGFGAYDELNKVRIVKPDLPLSLLGLVDEQRYGKDRAVEAPELPEAIRGVGSVQYTVSTLPAGLTFTGSSRRITGTPTTAGTTTVTYTATDQTAGTPQTDSITFDIVIDETPPTLLTRVISALPPAARNSPSLQMRQERLPTEEAVSRRIQKQ